MDHDTPKFVLLHRNRLLTAEAETLEEMVTTLRAVTQELAAMAASGKVWLLRGGAAADRAVLGTDCPDVAQQFGFEEAGKAETVLELDDDDMDLDIDDSELDDDDMDLDIDDSELDDDDSDLDLDSDLE